MSKLTTKTIQYSVYDKTANKTNYVDDTTSYKRPELAMMSDGLSGAGIMGEIDMPALLLDSMEIELVLNKANERAIAMFAPGSHKAEIRWVSNTIDKSTGASKIQANKDIVTYVPKSLDLGEIVNNETNEGTLVGEVLTYQHIIDGKTVIKIDKLNNVFQINGKDYAAEIQKAL